MASQSLLANARAEGGLAFDEQNARDLNHRFGTEDATVLVSSTQNAPPITIARLHSSALEHPPTAPAPSDAGYSVHVWMRSVAADLWVDGRERDFDPVPKGTLCLFDLTQNPVGLIRTSFEMVRFHFPGSAFETMSAQNDEAPLRMLRPSYGTADAVLHGLSLSLSPALNRSWEVSSLFVDYVALAAHAHLLAAYGPGVRRPGPRAGLLPWQERRVKELIDTHLDGRLSLLELATECRMSPSHFSRAFQRSTGQSPHQWLLDRRVEHAKRLLAQREGSLAVIAKACGFADTSHLIRVFSARCGASPGAWRKSKHA